MLTLAAWLHDLSPVAFRVGPLTIRWYGLSYLAGFAVAWLLFRWLSRRGVARIPPERVGDAVLACVVGVVVGGRLGYVLVYRPSLLWTFTDTAPWWELLAVNQGGMASHGGILGAIIAGWFVSRGPKGADGSRRQRVPYLHVMDVLALLTPFGLGLGRIANFVNGELLGRIVAAPGEPAPWWAVKFPQELLEANAPALFADQQQKLDALADSVKRPDDSYGAGVERLIEAVQHGNRDLAEQLAPLVSARHPSQLYQGVAEGVVLAAVLWFVARKPRVPGIVGCWFLITYGVLRVITEIWRLPDSHLASPRVLGLSRGQWLSVAMVGVGAFFLVKLSRSNKPRLGGWATNKAPEPRKPADVPAR